MNQLEIHKKIDKFFKAGVGVADVDVAKDLIKKNFDAKDYFFFKADENWLDWLWENGFLVAIKEKADDPTKFSYTIPELEYLSRIAEVQPDKVFKIIKSVEISKENFNPEVINRFLWTINKMPVEQIKELTRKIKDDNWPYLMRKFNRSVYEYNKIVEKLAENKEYKALLEITEAILKVKNKEDKKDSHSLDKYFYLNHITEIKLFDVLVNIENNEWQEKALKLLVRIFEQIIKQQEKDGNVFEYQDTFVLYEADFFDVNLKNKRTMSNREDFDNLVITIKQLFKKVIESKCENDDNLDDLLKLIKDLSLKNCLAWRLYLFVLAQCPDKFKEEIKEALFKIFNVGERYFEVESGAEYYWLLGKCFNILDEDDQKKYIDEIFEYFNENLGDKDKEGWRKRDGKKILLTIKDFLGEKKEEAEKVFSISLEKDKHEPEPISSGVEVGSVNRCSPEPVSGYSVKEIIKKLKTEWTPEKLKEKYKDDDFRKPRGAGGLSDELKRDFKKRPKEYLENLNKFFDERNIYPHYLYSILRSIEEMSRDNFSFDDDMEKIINLFVEIQERGIENFEIEEMEEEWLANWVAVCRAVADIMLLFLQKEKIGKELYSNYRKELLDIIEYLLSIEQSPSKEDEGKKYGDLFGIAINSVRGRAYDVFVTFVYLDGDKKLSKEVKEIFKNILNEKSLPMRFIVGRYLATFYFRDKKFIKKRFEKLFPKDKKDIYLATWEGYLSNTLYSQLFNELKDYYEYAIGIDLVGDDKREHYKDPDEALAVHLALAYTYLDLKIDDPLFNQFWNKKNIKRLKEFISFIGRSCLSKNEIDDEWLKKNNVNKEKLIKFWDWVLKEKQDEKEIFSAFGYWLNPAREILDDKVVIRNISESLKLSGGMMDWDYALMERLSEFATKFPKETLEMLNYYFFNSVGEYSTERYFRLSGSQLEKSLKIIYEKGEKSKVKEMINSLMEKGGREFWNLKRIVE